MILSTISELWIFIAKFSAYHPKQIALTRLLRKLQSKLLNSSPLFRVSKGCKLKHHHLLESFLMHVKYVDLPNCPPILIHRCDFNEFLEACSYFYSWKENFWNFFILRMISGGKFCSYFWISREIIVSKTFFMADEYF